MGMERLLPKSGLINEPGYYILESDLNFNNQDIAVLINADNVTLDLKGHTLSYDGIPSIKNKGILASRKKHITIKNGHLLNFFSGITATGATTLIIENMVMENIRYMGINAQGKNVLIQNNQVKNMDFSFPRPAADSYIIGINIIGQGCAIVNNKIEMKIPDNNPTIELVGILIGAKSQSISIVANYLTNTVSTYKKSYAIWAGRNADAAIIGNVITNYFYDVAGTESKNLYLSNNKINNDKDYVRFSGDFVLETLFNSSSMQEKEVIKNHFEGLSI